MNKSRLEAFSDGVFAIIITIMVLELKIPERADMAAVRPLIPIFICYLLSFIYIAVYWNYHHHLMHTIKRVNASIMWANMHLLFWLSLVPFATGWMGRTNFDRITVATYGGLLILCGIAYTIMSKAIMRTHKGKSALAGALAKSDTKGIISVIVYCISIPAALFVHPVLSAVLFAVIAVVWLIPSRDIEKALEMEQQQ